MRSTPISIVLLVMTAMTFIQCASEAAPGGGPADTTPPFLVQSNVQTGDTRFPEKEALEFVFSETINTTTAKKSITIFPLGEEVAIVNIRSHSIVITPVNRWDPDIVYTIILGKNIADMRGNGIRQPLRFSFTSGESIPGNRITGQVLGLKTNTTAVIAISHRYGRADSLLTAPEYFTQSGPDGSFHFDYLPSEEFYVAGYIDLDKSNNFSLKFDGFCVPAQSAVVPDTGNHILYMEAVYDNFVRGRLLNAESTSPWQTKLSLQKNPAEWNLPGTIMINGFEPDSVIFGEKSCNIYHARATGDSLIVSCTGLYDQTGIAFFDTSFSIPVTAYPDSFYRFTSLGTNVLTTPPVSMPVLSGEFRTETDTIDLSLKKGRPGFYDLPGRKSKLSGSWIVEIPYDNMFPEMVVDTHYTVSLELPAEPEFGAVIGKIAGTIPAGLKLVLKNEKHRYESSPTNATFSFDKVSQGSYDLSYYLDRNGNGRRDVGRPYPFERPEFLVPLDSGIDVRARWDTELEEPLKIVVENES